MPRNVWVECFMTIFKQFMTLILIQYFFFNQVFLFLHPQTPSASFHFHHQKCAALKITEESI